MRVAGIDCGTNSIRLLIAESSAPGAPLTDILRRMEVVRLGEGVDQTGEFSPTALERTFACVDEYAVQCREFGVQSIRFAATSAARDAHNKEIFLQGIYEHLGIQAQVLSGEEEAQTSFRGAASVLPEGSTHPVIVVDLGGGSTEVVLGNHRQGVISSYSMDVGCVRMAERHLRCDPMSKSEYAAITADVEAMLDKAEDVVDMRKARGLVGLAGTITTITARARGLTRYDSSKIHGACLSLQETLKQSEWFASSTRAQREALGFMHPGRVEVMPAGALVWACIVRRAAQRMEEAGVELTSVLTSEHDILDGLAMWAAEYPQRPLWV